MLAGSCFCFAVASACSVRPADVTPSAQMMPDNVGS